MNRKFRLLASLGIVMVLTTFMLYTAFAGEDVREPVLQASDLAGERSMAMKRAVQLDGVAIGPVERDGDTMTFLIGGKADDDEKTKPVPVFYSGSVPDAFRVGRHVIVTGKLVEVDGADQFRAEKDSLVTKCPSKFESDGGSSRSSA